MRRLGPNGSPGGAIAAGLGSWAAPGCAIAPTRSQANVATPCSTSAGVMRTILHLPLGQAAYRGLKYGWVERTMVWRGAAHSNAVASFIGWSGATTSAGTIPPREFRAASSIASAVNSPLAIPGRPCPTRREIVSPPQIMALMRVADVASIFRPGDGIVATR